MNFQYLEVRPCIETYTRLADQTEEGSIDSYRSEEDYAEALEAVEKHGERFKTFWTLYGIDQEGLGFAIGDFTKRSEEHTSELQSLMRISNAVFCLKKKKIQIQ